MSYCGWDGSFSPLGRPFSPRNLTVIAGPCMLESFELGLEVGTFVSRLCRDLGLNYVFKSSFDKANRTSKTARRGPGLGEGLRQLARIKDALGVPVLTDIHSPEQAGPAAEVADILQIPAFLCEDLSLCRAAAGTGRCVQIKKGQHVSPQTLLGVAQILRGEGWSKVLLCERGSSFGYNDLVVDYRSLVTLAGDGGAVVMDATHAAQLPGAGEGSTAGLRHMIPALARAGVAVGVDGLFLEVHPSPEAALSDASTQLSFAGAQEVLQQVAAIASWRARSAEPRGAD